MSKDNSVNISFCSPFEEEVYSVLCNLGYEVVPQFKVGNCHADFKAKRDNLEFLVECDGKHHHTWDWIQKDIRREWYFTSQSWMLFRIPYSGWKKERTQVKWDIEQFARQIQRVPNEHPMESISGKDYRLVILRSLAGSIRKGANKATMTQKSEVWRRAHYYDLLHEEFMDSLIHLDYHPPREEGFDLHLEMLVDDLWQGACLNYAERFKIPVASQETLIESKYFRQYFRYSVINTLKALI